MREIKFRAWNGERMLNPVVLGESTNDAWSDYNYGAGHGLEIMQYTGVKDTNGKEIYEGDIIGNRKSKHKVIWNREYLCFSYPDYFWYENNGLLFSEEMELIGNVYENPELLSVTTTNE